MAEAAYQQVARMVIERIRVHPLLISCHERAIWAHTIHRGAGEYGIEAPLEIEKWWEVRRYVREDWAFRLATTLAKEVVRQWDGRGDGTSTHSISKGANRGEILFREEKWFRAGSTSTNSRRILF